MTHFLKSVLPVGYIPITIHRWQNELLEMFSKRLHSYLNQGPESNTF